MPVACLLIAYWSLPIYYIRTPFVHMWYYVLPIAIAIRKLWGAYTFIVIDCYWIAIGLPALMSADLRSRVSSHQQAYLSKEAFGQNTLQWGQICNRHYCLNTCIRKKQMYLYIYIYIYLYWFCVCLFICWVGFGTMLLCKIPRRNTSRFMF